MKFVFYLTIFLLSCVSVIWCLEDPTSSKRSKKAQKVVFYVLVASFVIMMGSVFGLIFTSPVSEGSARIELSTDTTYTTEWFSTDGPAVVMKLKTDKREARYYEIPKDKIIFWGGEDEKVPAKFRVLTDKEGKVYALKPVD